MLLASSDLEVTGWMKEEFDKSFEMKDLREAKLCIGLEISRKPQARTLSFTQRGTPHLFLGVLISQIITLVQPPWSYLKNNALAPDDPPAMCPYLNDIRCVMHFMACASPDIAFVAGGSAKHCETR